MPPSVGARAARLAPLSRSVAVHASFGPTWLWWGATWSYACGLAAALPSEATLSVAVGAVAGWIVAVPLFGAFWAPLLSSSAGSGPYARGALPDGASRAPAGRRAPSGTIGREGVAAAAMLGAALVLSWTIGASIALALALGALLLAAAWLVSGHVPEPTGATRSVLEIFIPATVGWLAIGGAVSAPAALVASEGTAWAVGSWMAANGNALLVFAAFALMHHGATTALRRRELSRRWWEITVGYVTVALVLAGAGEAAAATAVGVLFVVSWPFHAALRSGRVLWHLRHAQPLSMVAMLVASAAV